MKQSYVVTITGRVYVDCTIAVLADSREDAARQAREGVNPDTSEWLHYRQSADELVVSDVSEERSEELAYADQKHLLKFS